MSSPVFGEDLTKIWPLIYDGQRTRPPSTTRSSCSSWAGARSPHAMMMMIPEAWENHTLMDPTRRAFYEYHSAIMEPWDGPASIAFTDGRSIGATLDRNGLRPSRYVVTDGRPGRSWARSAAACRCPEESIVKKWRLQPGKMFLVDLEKGRHRRRRGAQGQARRASSPIGVARAASASSSTKSDTETAPPLKSERDSSTGSRPSATRRRTSSSSWRRWR